MNQTMTHRTKGQGTRALVVFGVAAAAAILGAIPAAADDHSTSVPSLQTPTSAVEIFDDHSTAMDQLNGGADDHITGTTALLRLR
ncbi:hypothetical protein [Streptomyces sp. NPDC046261]|uniref:hypothetical protein n=1 Tax=Streptomyces sp. NPDC046261 TaxID=3157200 RepID=UPI0033DD3D42